MPTIVAICPYCRLGGVRAQNTAIGASATCPKCKSSFTLLPTDELPDWAAKAGAEALSFAKSSPLEETHPAAAMPDVTEPSPVLPTEKRRRKNSATPTPAPAPAPVPAAPEPQPAPALSPSPPALAPVSGGPTAIADMGLLFALVGIILVGPAVLISQLPYGRVIGLVVAGVGVVAGLLALGGEGRAKLAGAGAMTMHLIVCVVLLFLPGWLNLDPWQSAPAEETKGPSAVEHATGLPTPVASGEWLDAGKRSWEFKDVRVTVRSASVGPVELRGPKDAKRIPKEPYLQLTLLVANVGVERPIPLSRWAAGKGAEGVQVVDSSGKSLALATFEAGWTPDPGHPVAQVLPGRSSEVRLVFVAPSAKSEFLRLQLSGSAIGFTDEIKFRVGLSGPAFRSPNK
jgi:hypothetical protein